MANMNLTVNEAASVGCAKRFNLHTVIEHLH